MTDRPADDICPKRDETPVPTTIPFSTPIYLTSVWECETPHQAERLLTGELPGYVYQRDGHPNADTLVHTCRALHRTEHAVATSSGMSALAAILLAYTQHGDHMVISSRLYGKSLYLLGREAQRLGVSCDLVDTTCLEAVREGLRPETKLVVVETIANPTLEIADIAGLSNLLSSHAARLVVDNTFATPALCQPLSQGADLVMESASKMMNGHSDAMVGIVASREGGGDWERVGQVMSAYGLTSSPFDCWLVARGLSTMHLRVRRASENAQAAAEYLQQQPRVKRVLYPGLSDDPQHALAARTLSGGFGSVLTMELAGSRAEADRFIGAAGAPPFCPSLGETATTVSHPATTSHRGLSVEERRELGISDAMIRISCGIESAGHVIEMLDAGLSQL